MEMDILFHQPGETGLGSSIGLQIYLRGRGVIT